MPVRQPISLIQQAFGTSSPMVAVARCESNLRQYNANGTILRGIVNNADVGLYQVNEKYHLAQAKSMGLDIYSVEGNIQYAKYLYQKNGLSDWLASKPCWSKSAS